MTGGDAELGGASWHRVKVNKPVDGHGCSGGERDRGLPGGKRIIRRRRYSGDSERLFDVFGLHGCDCRSIRMDCGESE